MFPIDVISRIIHVLMAITLLGGSIFSLLVLMPSAKQLPDEPHNRLAGLVTGRWKKFVHIGVLILLVTGLYNYVRATGVHKGDGLYHALLGIKMLLALGVFFIAAALVGRSAKLESMRQNRAKWLKIAVLLGVTIVGISGFVKVRGLQDKPAEKIESVENVESVNQAAP